METKTRGIVYYSPISCNYKELGSINPVSKQGKCPTGWEELLIKFGIRSCIDFSQVTNPSTIKIPKQIYDSFKHNKLIVNKQKKRLSFLTSNNATQCEIYTTTNIVLSMDANKIQFIKMFNDANPQLQDNKNINYGKVKMYDFIDTSEGENIILSLKHFKDSVNNLGMGFIDLFTNTNNILSNVGILPYILIGLGGAYLFIKYKENKSIKGN